LIPPDKRESAAGVHHNRDKLYFFVTGVSGARMERARQVALRENPLASFGFLVKGEKFDVSRKQKAECANCLAKPIKVRDDGNAIPAHEVVDP
jgi:hypothetical protein